MGVMLNTELDKGAKSFSIKSKTPEEINFKDGRNIIFFSVGEPLPLTPKFFHPYPFDQFLPTPLLES